MSLHLLRLNSNSEKKALLLTHQYLAEEDLVSKLSFNWSSEVSKQQVPLSVQKRSFWRYERYESNQQIFITSCNSGQRLDTLHRDRSACPGGFQGQVQPFSQIQIPGFASEAVRIPPWTNYNAKKRDLRNSLQLRIIS
jgi:hypothetical protein